MTADPARIQARAALTASSATPVSAAEVAFTLGVSHDVVAGATPGDAYDLDGVRWAPWRSWLAALGHRVEVGPAATPAEPALTTWMAIAEAIGVSDETIRRARLKHGSRQRPYFESVAAARAWWSELGRPRPRATQARPARQLRDAEAAPFDPSSERDRHR